jgi:hypothetical protein
MPPARPIVNANDLEWQEARHGGRFAHARKAFALPAGGVKLGCPLFRVQPGRSAFPAHRHHANEEAIHVPAGEGILRLDGAEHTVGPGAAPPADPWKGGCGGIPNRRESAYLVTSTNPAGRMGPRRRRGRRGRSV